MSSNSNTVVKLYSRSVKDFRSHLTAIAARVRAGAQDTKDAVCNTLGQNYYLAAKAMRKAEKKATRLTRRYPIQTIATCLALGFLIGRSRR